MSGEWEICDIVDVLNKLNLCYIEILLFYVWFLNSEQNCVFQLYSGWCIVLVINVVEILLIVLGIKYVIDFGIVCISCYSYCIKVQCLLIEFILQVFVNQCKGCCGCVFEGICICFYFEDDFFLCLEFIDLEILCINLVLVILQMIVLGLGDIVVFLFVEVLDKCNIQDGVCLFEELGVIIMDEQVSVYKLMLFGCQFLQLFVDLCLVCMVLEV